MSELNVINYTILRNCNCNWDFLILYNYNLLKFYLITSYIAQEHIICFELNLYEVTVLIC